MSGIAEILNRAAKNCARKIARLKTDKRANVAMMFALMAPVLVGGLGMGMESAYWYVDQRQMQNAWMRRRSLRRPMERPTTPS